MTTQWSALAQWVSKLHALVIHFPIALILVAGAAEFIGLIFPRTNGRHVARFCIWMALLGAIGAGVTGWLKVVAGPYATAMPAEVSQHRWAGTIAATAVLLSLVTCEWSNRRQGMLSRGAYLALLLVAMLSVAAAGHLGGELVYGEGFLAFEPQQIASADAP